MEEDLITFLEGSHRKGTKRAYNKAWTLWTDWCRGRHPPVDFLEYNLKNLHAFFFENKYRSLQSLRTCRAALASVFQELYPDETRMADHQSLKSFFKAKRKTTVTLPKKHQLETWDIQILIQHIRTYYSNNDELTSLQLQVKTVLILCIATMWRPRSDIGRIQFRDVIFSGPLDNPTGVTIFVREPKEAQFNHSRLGAIEDRTVCPVHTLKTFCDRTHLKRQHLPENQTLFLACIDKKECRSIETSTIAGYLRDTMKAAGLNTIEYTPHSIRAASSTFAAQLGLSDAEIKVHANWSKYSTTFEDYYFKPIAQESNGAKIVSAIFSFSAEKSTTSEPE
jgi:integrase